MGQCAHWVALEIGEAIRPRQAVGFVFAFGGYEILFGANFLVKKGFAPFVIGFYLPESGGAFGKFLLNPDELVGRKCTKYLSFSHLFTKCGKYPDCR
jgi:hypothetical protein